VAKRQSETLTPAELDELIQLTDMIEEYDSRRLAALDALARARGVTLRVVMEAIGITPPPYA
jgi:hypothetical protein